MVRAPVTWSMLMLAGACSSDVLHSTAWKTRCELVPDAEECAAKGASSSASAGGSGATGGAAHAGGAGAFAVGGKGGRAGSGGGGACDTCGNEVQSNDPDLPLCPGSQEEYDALVACVCEACKLECQDPCVTMMNPTDAVCQDCLTQSVVGPCADPFQACMADGGG